jgi:hypothetical protein
VAGLDEVGRLLAIMTGANPRTARFIPIPATTVTSIGPRWPARSARGSGSCGGTSTRLLLTRLCMCPVENDADLVTVAAQPGDRAIFIRDR